MSKRKLSYVNWKQEVLVEHLATAKRANSPSNLENMTVTMLKEFAQRLTTLKDSFAPQIKDLIQIEDLMQKCYDHEHQVVR